MVRLINILAGVGLWPACLLVTLQYGFFLECTVQPPKYILLLTFIGTCSIYVADRFLEKTAGHFLENRHEFSFITLFLVIVMLSMSLFYFCLHAMLWDWLWLAGLGGSGLVYLLITSGWIPSFISLKELIGTGIFILLVLGRVSATNLVWSGLLCLALSNFIWSGFFDRDRDRENSVLSLAGWHEGKAVLLARFTGFVSFLLFFLSGRSLFLTTVTLSAALHIFWPTKYQKNDLAFLPLVFWAFTMVTMEIVS